MKAIEILKKRPLAAYSLAIVLFALAVFRVVLTPGSILFTTDDNVGALAFRKAALPFSFTGWWDDSVLAGIPSVLQLNWTNLLLWILPATVFATWIHAIDLVLASVFLALFLRQRGMGWTACVLGALAVFWVGTNFTLTYAGHIGKFALLMFASAALWLIEKSARGRSWAWPVLAGGAMGVMFLEQADVALLFAMFLMPYAAYAVLRERGRDWRGLASVLVPMLAVAGLIALRPVSRGYQLAVKGVATVNEEDPAAQWEFATQWSWPPEESIDFIAPGFTGWRSGEPEGPYWGRMGRSAGWEDTRQGFQNFKLENQYIGAVPIIFAVWACIAAWGLRKRRSPGWGDVFFWGAATVAALLLSFGKYFPAYRLLYMLPGVSSIRNPNKFLHIVQLGVGILAAYGFSWALEPAAAQPGAGPRAAGRFVKVLWILFGLLVLVALGIFSSWGDVASAVASEGWGSGADAIVRNRVWALGQAAFMVFCGALALWRLLLRPAPKALVRAAIPWVVVGLVAADALALNRHYVKPLAKSLIEENDVVRLLKQVMGVQRVALISQESFYNAWLTYLFPYHHIKALNVTQMPRMPEDYQAFLDALGSQPVRLWQLTAVGFVVGPAQVWAQIQQDPRLKEMFELIYAFNVTPDEEGGVRVVSSTAEQPGQHCILRMKPVPLRYAMLDSWTTLPDEEVLRRLTANDYVPFREVLVSASTAGGLAEGRGQNAVSDVAVREQRPGRVHLRVSTERAAMVRAAEKYDPDWKATVDGQPAPLLRCDGIFQGVCIQPGLREIVLEYAPGTGTLWVQALGMAVCLGAIISLAVSGRRKDEQ